MATPAPVCGCHGSSALCIPVVFPPIFPNEEECSGVTTSTIQELTNVWNITNCIATYSDILNTAPDGTRQYNPANLMKIQQDIALLLDTYTKVYGFNFTSNTSSPQYDSFQNDLFNLCSSTLVPGGCDFFLTNYCSQFTRDQIEKDRALTTMCGCYAPPSFPTSTIPARCDPICHLVGNVQLADPCTGVIESCNNTVCVIDDVNIALTNSNPSVIAFTQICPGCSASAPCTCIIGGVSVVDTITNSGVGAQ